MALPPAHRFTHDPVLVLECDPAWNKERIKADESAIARARLAREAGVDSETPLEPCPWPSAADHPVSLYSSGESRFDLRTVQPWLLPDSPPSMFVLRRLSWSDFLTSEHLRTDLSNAGAAHVHAVRFGLLRVTNLDGFSLPDRDHRDAAPLTMVECERLRERIGDVSFRELAAAIWMVSRAPTPTEGKPSGSPLGA